MGYFEQSTNGKKWRFVVLGAANATGAAQAQTDWMSRDEAAVYTARCALFTAKLAAVEAALCFPDRCSGPGGTVHGDPSRRAAANARLNQILSVPLAEAEKALDAELLRLGVVS